MNIFVFSLFVAILGASALANEEENGFKCQMGVHYQENQCNGCVCGSDGLLSCSFMACVSKDYTRLQNCERGTTWNEGCEQCWCTNFGTICTTDCGKNYNIH